MAAVIRAAAAAVEAGEPTAHPEEIAQPSEALREAMVAVVAAVMAMVILPATVPVVQSALFGPVTHDPFRQQIQGICK